MRKVTYATLFLFLFILILTATLFGCSQPQSDLQEETVGTTGTVGTTDAESTSCPVCGSENVTEISFGLPAFSEELDAQVQSGEVVLGGCVVSSGSPKYHCRDCGKDFGRLDF